MSVIGEARREAWQSRFSRIAHTQNSDESISRDTHTDHALPEPRNGKHLANTRWLSKIYLCGDERNTWFTVGNFRIVFTRGLKWWFMDIFRGIRVNGIKARERLGRTFLWGGRAGRLLGGPNLKETFLVYPCLRCVLSGAQLPPSKWDSLSFSRPPRPFQRFIIGRWSFLVDSNHRCWLENRKGAAREGVLVRFSIRDKSANNALPPPSFLVYRCCVRFLK